MTNNNVGLQLNIEDYLTDKSSGNQFIQRRKYKMAGGAGAAAMHYIGMSMLGGIVVGAVASGIKGASDVNKTCNEIDNIKSETSNVTKFMITEMTKRKMVSKSIKDVDNACRKTIANLQIKIEEEETRHKNIYNFNLIINLVSVTSFILVIVSKIIVAKYNL